MWQIFSGIIIITHIRSKRTKNKLILFHSNNIDNSDGAKQMKT